MKKKIAFMLTMVLCFTFALSGCDLFALDYKKYLAQPIVTLEYSATTGNAHTVKITKEELMQAYNRYGQTLSQNGTTGKAAITYLVDYLINQKVILNEVEDLIADGTILSTQDDKNKTYNEIWNNTYDSMINLLADYEEEVITDWNLTTPSSLTEEETDDKKVYTEYEQKANIVYKNGEYYIELVDNSVDDPITHTYQTDIKEIISEIQTAIETKIGKNNAVKTDSEKVMNEAYKRYVSALKDYEKGKNLSTINAEVFNREILRIYNQMKDNSYISLYTDYLAGENNVSPITINDVFTYLEGQMKASYTKYTMNLDTYKTDILSNRASIFYAIQNSNLQTPTLGDYFYVSHILIKFTDKQKEDLTNLETLLNNGIISPETYNTERQKIVNQTKVKGDGACKDMTYAQFMQTLSNAMDGKDDLTKMQTFREYLYAYSEDDGNKNAEFEYIVGSDDSKMVTTFTNVARELHDANEYGKIASNYDEYLSLPNADVSSEYGLHILFYIGEVENVFDIGDIDTFTLTNVSDADIANNIARIQNFKLSDFNTKTMFDLVYEKLSADSVSYLEKLNLTILKDPDNVSITKHPQNYKDLY